MPPRMLSLCDVRARAESPQSCEYPPALMCSVTLRAGTRPITPHLRLSATCALPAVNSALGFRSPKMPGEPMRVQPSRARRVDDEDS